MTYNTNQLLNNLYNQTEEHLNLVIAQWQSLPPIRLLTQPSPGKWSAAQCLDHLNSYGRYYLPAIEKALAGATAKPAPDFTSGWLGNYFYNLMLPERKGKQMKKMKAPKNHTPVVQLNSAKVVDEFISQQEMLEQLIDRSRKTDISKVRIPISIAPLIKLKLGDTFLFLVAHNKRHILQAQKALDESCFQIKEVQHSGPNLS